MQQSRDSTHVSFMLDWGDEDADGMLSSETAQDHKGSSKSGFATDNIQNYSVQFEITCVIGLHQFDVLRSL